MDHVSFRFGLACSVLVSTLAAQADILCYRFDEGYGTEAINYAAAGSVPLQGQITSNTPPVSLAAWVPGRFGAALGASLNTTASSQRVDTGWIPNHTGSFSFGLWIKAGPAAPTSIWYAFGVPVSFGFRFYSVGTTGTLSTVGFAGQSFYANTTSIVYPLTVGNWVHIAFVADSSTMTFTYYINGVAEVPKPITAPISIVYPSSLTVGQQLTTSAGSPFDIDELVFAPRAWTAAEVAVFSKTSYAANGAYDGGCGSLTLGGTGGLPKIGNFLYQLTLNSPTPLVYSVGFGSNRASLGGIPLPVDLGLLVSGIGTCMIDSSLDLFTLGGGKGIGSIAVGVPIPANPALDGLTLFLQAYGVGSGKPIEVSNPLSIGLGR